MIFHEDNNVLMEIMRGRVSICLESATRYYANFEYHTGDVWFRVAQKYCEIIEILEDVYFTESVLEDKKNVEEEI